MRNTSFYLRTISVALLTSALMTLPGKAQEATNAGSEASTESPTPEETTTSNANDDETKTAPLDTYGDWKISCPDQAPCRMAQSIVTVNDNKIILQMRVFKGKEGAKDTALFSFPLGILLNTGWQIKIDNGKTQLLPFEICKVDGCHSGINIPASLLNRMKRGNILNVKFFDASQKAIEPKISLKGFTKAWGELK